MENLNQNTEQNLETNVNQPETSGNENLTVERAPVDLKDDDLIPLTINGERVLKPYKEAREGFQRHEDYTRKTQSVAAKIKEAQDVYDRLQAREREIAEKELLFDKLLGRAPKEDKQDLGDDDVVTVKQVRQMMEDIKNGVTKDVSNTLETYGKRTAEQQTYARWDSMIKETVTALAKEHPLLGKIPHLDALLKKEAQRERPTSEEELLTSVLKAGKRLAQEFDAHYTEQRKQEVVRKKNLSEKGPEPKGGVTQFTTKKDYTKNNGRKIDWGAIETDVKEALGNDDDE